MMNKENGELPDWVKDVVAEAVEKMDALEKDIELPLFGEGGCLDTFMKVARGERDERSAITATDYAALSAITLADVIHNAKTYGRRRDFYPRKLIEKFFIFASMIASARAALLNSSKNPAAEMAKKRHAENYALADEAIAYWRENIDPALSASKAAEALLGVVPFSHKKLAEIVSAERKKKKK